MTMLNPNWKKVQTLAPSGTVSFHTQFDMVRMFHVLGGLPVGVPGEVISGDEIDRRVAMINEEVSLELLPALESLKKDYTTAKVAVVADGIADSIYVLLGTAVTLGIPFDTIFAVVHMANVGKVKDTVVVDERGKVQKPSSWVAPPVQKLIEESIQQFQASLPPQAANEPTQ
jgi:hypothetical protein